MLRLVPAGGTGAAAAADILVGKFIVIGGAVIAAAGSGALFCLTADSALDGLKTPVDIADSHYGTHFGDVIGWVHGEYSSSSSGRSVSPRAEPREKSKKRPGRIYVSYKRFNEKTNRYYLGRTSMVVDLNKDLSIQAALAVALREKNHHVDENLEPKDAGFIAAEVDEFDTGTAVDYGRRYDDAAYWRVRGREQQLIDFHGGAWSDTGKPYRTENAVRGVAKDNPQGRWFHEAATGMWRELHPYTGY